MALKIIRKQNIFKVEGQINKVNASYFKTHFVITLNVLSGLVIDINKVTEIDSSGIQALKYIFKNALKFKKPFSIVGNGSKEIYAEFGYTKIA
jgi:anti-anti-sigma regulatory factor